MTARALSAAATREALLDAGLTVAGQHGLAGMSVNRVVAEAGVAKGTFYVHFADRDEFLAALRKRFDDEVRAEVAAAIGSLGPGAMRLRGGMEAYLDVCLRHQGVKALLLEARNDPGVAGEMGARTAAFAALAEADLAAMGWDRAGTAAGMVVAMAAELSLAELAVGRADPAGRDVLWRMLQRLDLG
jgi:AcrR family transcriptional regulator